MVYSDVSREKIRSFLSTSNLFASIVSPVKMNRHQKFISRVVLFKTHPNFDQNFTYYQPIDRSPDAGSHQKGVRRHDLMLRLAGIRI